MNKSVYILFLFVLTLSKNSFTQNYAPAKVVNGDTIITFTLKPMIVSDKLAFKNKKRVKSYWRLRKKVVAVYPYAQKAKQLLYSYNVELSQIKSKHKRRAYLKKAEAELKKQFEDDIRNMSLSEGMILIKLIDRETHNTSYQLIKDLRGSVSAFFWQNIGRLFSVNLKAEYDPSKNEEDQLIELIVQQIEWGYIPVKKIE
ncbi:MAG TPA: DUF4294 domain-containing protein [Flavobacteriales bacterium]|nr:DUF4294 domain-containing protein [Flavobacteriales bacterium]|tara:strand:+ start:13337 stop:13936 length:600 start_codon:yes stop_codon:yes gene_type:complete